MSADGNVAFSGLNFMLYRAMPQREFAKYSGVTVGVAVRHIESPLIGSINKLSVTKRPGLDKLRLHLVVGMRRAPAVQAQLPVQARTGARDAAGHVRAFTIKIATLNRGYPPLELWHRPYHIDRISGVCPSPPHHLRIGRIIPNSARTNPCAR